MNTVMAAFLLAGIVTPQLDPTVGADPEVAIEFVEMEVASVGIELQSRQPLALLHSDWDRVLPIWIGELEAGAIARALQGAEFPRPLTHDLLVSTIETMGGMLEEVRVTELRDGTYYGLLYIRTAEGLVEVDTRPSDALALAVRTDARIRVAAALLEDPPELDFVAASGGDPVVRLRGVTLGPPPGTGLGAQVMHVTPEIERRGLLAGDRITRVGDRDVSDPIDFLQTVLGLQGQGSIEVTRVRDGEEETLLLPAPRGPGRIGE